METRIFSEIPLRVLLRQKNSLKSKSYITIFEAMITRSRSKSPNLISMTLFHRLNIRTVVYKALKTVDDVLPNTPRIEVARWRSPSRSLAARFFFSGCSWFLCRQRFCIGVSYDRRVIDEVTTEEFRCSQGVYSSRTVRRSGVQSLTRTIHKSPIRQYGVMEHVFGHTCRPLWRHAV